MLKIATYNLRNLFDEGVRMGYGSDITVPKVFVDGVVGELSKTISSIDPDILVAQEVASDVVFNRIAATLPARYETFVAAPDQRGIGNAAMMKVEGQISSSIVIGGFPITVLGDNDIIGNSITSAREFIHITTTYNEKPLHIYGVHLKARSGSPLRKTKGGERIQPKNQQEETDGIIRGSVFRLAQARRLRELADMHFKEDQNAQIIILGDYNAKEDTDSLRVITGSATYPETQLIDLCKSLPKEERFSFIYKGEYELLDHVLISRQLEHNVVSLKILNQTLVDQSGQPETDFYTSDHAPVVLTLR